METLRTPDDRFTGLPDFEFTPHYTEIPDGSGGELRVHHLDEGPADAPIVLLMHGEPSWCFLYRKMIPVLVDAGLRVLAPDFAGSGPPARPGGRPTSRYHPPVTGMPGWPQAADG